MATVELNQYHASGTVTSAHGATGVMQTLIPLISGTEVTAGTVIDSTPNGAKTSFSDTLPNAPVGRRRLIITYTVGGDDYTCSDDGTGVISDDATGHLTSGTITHSTGAWTLEFSSAPDNLTDITAEYLYGDPGQDWRVLIARNTRDNNNAEISGVWTAGDCKEYILHNTGTSGQENVLVGVREFQHTGSTLYACDLNIYSSYTTDMAWNANSAITLRTAYDTTYRCWGGSSYTTFQLPKFVYNDTSMDYHLYSNQNRVIIALDVGGNDETMYLGFIRRYGSSADYPYPCLAKGNSWGVVNYSNTSSTNGREYIIKVDSAQYAWALMVILPDNSVPAQGGVAYSTDSVLTYPTLDYSKTGVWFLKETYGDERTLLQPVYLLSTSKNYVLGDYDGVLQCPSVTINPHDTIKDHATQIRYRVFKNVNRTNDYQHMAVAEDNFTTTTTTTTTTTSSTTTAP